MGILTRPDESDAGASVAKGLTKRQQGRTRITVTVVLLVVALVAVFVMAKASRERIPSAGPASDGSGSWKLGWISVKNLPVPKSLDKVSPLTGAEAKVPSTQGTVLINFWASTCGPCREELPLLQHAATERIADAKIVGISRDMYAHYARSLLRKTDVSYPNYDDPAGYVMTDLASIIPPSEVPSSILVKDGRIVAAHIGVFHSYDDLVKGVSRPWA